MNVVWNGRTEERKTPLHRRPPYRTRNKISQVSRNKQINKQFKRTREYITSKKKKKKYVQTTYVETCQHVCVHARARSCARRRDGNLGARALLYRSAAAVGGGGGGGQPVSESPWTVFDVSDSGGPLPVRFRRAHRATTTDGRHASVDRSKYTGQRGCRISDARSARGRLTPAGGGGGGGSNLSRADTRTISAYDALVHVRTKTTTQCPSFTSVNDTHTRVPDGRV